MPSNSWERVVFWVASLLSLMFEFAVSFYFPREENGSEKNEIFGTCSVLTWNLFVRAASASMLHDCRHRFRLLHFRHLHQINIPISTNATIIASKLQCQCFVYSVSISSLFNLIPPQFDADFTIRIVTDMIWHRSPFIYDMIYETWLVATGTE